MTDDEVNAAVEQYERVAERVFQRWMKKNLERDPVPGAIQEMLARNKPHLDIRGGPRLVHVTSVKRAESPAGDGPLSQEESDDLAKVANGPESCWMSNEDRAFFGKVTDTIFALRIAVRGGCIHPRGAAILIDQAMFQLDLAEPWAPALRLWNERKWQDLADKALPGFTGGFPQAMISCLGGLQMSASPFVIDESWATPCTPEE